MASIVKERDPLSVVIFIVFCLLLLLLQECAASKSEEALLIHLFEKYDKTARPVLADNDSVQVTLGFTLSQIIDVEEKNQLLTISANIRQLWYNQLLTWDPKRFNGIKKINVHPKRIWLPDIVLYNNADEDKSFGGNLDRLNTRVKLDSDGKAQWLAPVILKSKCPINVKYFPFDEQRCQLKFGSWTYDEGRVNLTSEGNQADLTSYLINAEWQLDGAPAKRTASVYICCPGKYYPDVTYTIIVKRRSLFYLCNLIFPMTVIGMLTMLSFLLPAESGERVSLAITLLLAMTVFMLVVADIIPATSEVVPLVAIFFSSAMVEMVVMIIVLCYVMQLYHKQAGDPPMPKWMRTYVLDWLSYKLNVRHYQPLDAANSSDDVVSRQECSKGKALYQACCGDETRSLNDVVNGVLPSGMDRPITSSADYHGRLWGERYRNRSGPPPYDSTSLNGCMVPSSFERKNQYNSTLKASALWQQQRYDKAFQDETRNTPRSVEARLIIRKLDVIVNKMERDEEDNETLSEWRIVAMTIDKVLLYIFVSVLTVTVLSCFLNAPGYVA